MGAILRGRAVVALPAGAGGGIDETAVLALIAAERAATTARAGGLPLTLGATEIAASGAQVDTVLTMPSGIVATGRRVDLRGVATLRAVSDNALLGTWHFAGVGIVRLASAPFWRVDDAGTRAPGDLDASLSDYLSDSEADAPRFGFDASTGAVGLSLTLRADAPGAARLAFVGAAANLGAAP